MDAKSRIAQEQGHRMTMRSLDPNHDIHDEKIDQTPIMDLSFGILWNLIPDKSRPLYLDKVLKLPIEQQYIFKVQLIKVFSSIKKFKPSQYADINKKLKDHQEQHGHIKENLPSTSLLVVMCNYINVSKQGISINFDNLDSAHVAQIAGVVESHSSMCPSIDDIKEMYSIYEDFRESCNFNITLMTLENNYTYLKCITYGSTDEEERSKNDNGSNMEDNNILVSSETTHKRRLVASRETVAATSVNAVNQMHGGSSSSSIHQHQMIIQEDDEEDSHELNQSNVSVQNSANNNNSDIRQIQKIGTIATYATIAAGNQTSSAPTQSTNGLNQSSEHVQNIQPIEEAMQIEEEVVNMDGLIQIAGEYYPDIDNIMLNAYAQWTKRPLAKMTEQQYREQEKMLYGNREERIKVVHLIMLNFNINKHAKKIEGVVTNDKDDTLLNYHHEFVLVNTCVISNCQPEAVMNNDREIKKDQLQVIAMLNLALTPSQYAKLDRPASVLNIDFKDNGEVRSTCICFEFIPKTVTSTAFFMTGSERSPRYRERASTYSPTFGVTLLSKNINNCSNVGIVRGFAIAETNHVARSLSTQLSLLIPDTQLIAYPIYTYFNLKSGQANTNVYSFVIFVDPINNVTLRQKIQEKLFMSGLSSIVAVRGGNVEVLKEVKDCMNLPLKKDVMKSYKCIRIDNIKYIPSDLLLLGLKDIVEHSYIKHIYYHQMHSESAVTYYVVVNEEYLLPATLNSDQLQLHVFGDEKSSRVMMSTTLTKPTNVQSTKAANIFRITPDMIENKSKTINTNNKLIVNTPMRKSQQRHK